MDRQRNMDGYLRALLAGLGVVSVSLAGCAKKPLIVLADPAPLEVPLVPPRVLGPVAVEEPAPPPVEATAPAPARPNGRPRNTGRTADPVVKVEPPPDPNAKPAEGTVDPNASGSSSAAPEPAPLLRTDSADDAEVARKVRDTLGRANENLNKANYNNLGAGAKSQYDTARRFIAQSENALKARNLTFARYVADKAEALSASLLNR